MIKRKTPKEETYPLAKASAEKNILAVSKELEMPDLINRLNGEIRALQFHLNRQREATAAAEKRAADVETRLRERREVRDAPDDSENFRKIARKQIKANEALKIELEDERRKVKDLQRKVDTMEQKLRAEQNLANEQIRKLRKNCADLQTKLENTEKNLQEKTKLLELQNIYTQRIPKTALMKNAELDFQRETNCYIDEVLNSISTSYRQASRSQPPPTLTSRANKILERNQHKPQAANCTISNTVTKRNDNRFTPPNASDVLGAFEKVEHRESSKSMDGKNGQQSHHQSSVDKDSSSADSVDKNAVENFEDVLIKRTEFANEVNTITDGKATVDLGENIDLENKTIESVSTAKIPKIIDESTINTTLAEVTELQAQMERMILHHGPQPNNGDSPTNLEKVLQESEKLSSTLKKSAGTIEKVETSQKDKLLWNTFGKKESEESTLETIAVELQMEDNTENQIITRIRKDNLLFRFNKNEYTKEQRPNYLDLTVTLEVFNLATTSPLREPSCPQVQITTPIIITTRLKERSGILKPH
ncbi:hypothetical protein ACTXT7_008025 [Hymenolepis weldensis]